MIATDGSTPAAGSRGRRSLAGYQLTAAAVLAACAGLAWFYLRATAGASVPAATQVGRLYGLAGMLLFALLSLYGLRRTFYHGRLGSLELWYRAHLVLGVLALVLLGCHSGFGIRSAFLGALQIGFWGSVLTGALGWAYQTAFKRWMVRHEIRPAVLKELDRQRTAVLEQLRQLQPEGSPGEQGDAGGLHPDIERAIRRMAQLRRRLLGRFPDAQLWEKQQSGVLTAEELRGLPAGADTLLCELNRIEVLRSYHLLLRWWTTAHLFFTAVGVQLMIWHVVLVALYPR